MARKTLIDAEQGRNLGCAALDRLGRYYRLDGCFPVMNHAIRLAKRLLPGAEIRRLKIVPVRGPGLIIPKSSFRWLHHFVPVISGRVHCAWHPDLVLPPRRYAREAFPGQAVALVWVRYDGEPLKRCRPVVLRPTPAPPAAEGLP